MSDETLHTSMREARHWNESELNKRQQLGDVCYIAREDARCVHFSWTTQRLRRIADIGYEIELPEKHTWIYHCYTTPTHRDRSINTKVLMKIVEDVKKRNGELVWVSALETSRASVQAIEKAGFVEVAHLEKTVLFSCMVLQRRRTILQAPWGHLFDQMPARWTT